jgi:hypothetical protein
MPSFVQIGEMAVQRETPLAEHDEIRAFPGEGWKEYCR